MEKAEPQSPRVQGREVRDAGGPARPRWRRTWPGRTGPSDLVRRVHLPHSSSRSSDHCADITDEANASHPGAGFSIHHLASLLLSEILIRQTKSLTSSTTD